MSDWKNSISCTTGSWLFAAAVGFLAMVLLLLFGGFGFWAAAFFGGLLALVVGIFLSLTVCGGTPDPAALERAARKEQDQDVPAAETAQASPADPVEAAAAQAPAAPAPVVTASEEAPSAPIGFDGPRDGTADDLKQIKGVGVKLEGLLNEMGYYHFDQIANWTPAQVAWVDDNLKGFKGRVSRDGWVDQASVLARGGETEFSRRVEDGDVY